MSDEKKIAGSSKEDEKEQIESRRKALRKILISGGVVAGASFLPDKWVKPVVDSIVVPAHGAPLPVPAPAASPSVAPSIAPSVAPSIAPSIAPTTAPA